MAFANLPLVWLFGGRNNILIWATGWSFATFNVFHRHVARVATLQGVAHSILYFAIYIRGEYGPSRWLQEPGVLSNAMQSINYGKNCRRFMSCGGLW